MKRTSDPATREHARSIANVLSDDANLLIIKTFVIAARYMSFKAAARHLCLTPGAVSHRIARLEQVLGFPLFNRLTRSVTLTVEGGRLRAVYESALAKIQEEISRLLDDDGLSSLTIFAHPSIAMGWLIPHLPGFQAEHPNLHINIRTGNNPTDFSHESGVDVALYYSSGSFTGLASRRIMGENAVPVCTPAYAAAHRLEEGPQNLAGCTLLHDSAPWHFCTVTAEWQEWASRHGLDIQKSPSMIFDSAYAASLAAANGLGVALGRTRLMEDLLHEKRLIMPFPQLAPLESSHAYYAVWPRSRHTPAIVSTFVDWLERIGSADKDAAQASPASGADAAPQLPQAS